MHAPRIQEVKIPNEAQGKFLNFVHTIRASRQKKFKKGKEIIQPGFILSSLITVRSESQLKV